MHDSDIRMTSIIRTVKQSGAYSAALSRLSGRKSPNISCNRYYPAGAANAVLDRCTSLKSGDKLSGYTIEKVVPITELNLVSVLLTHDRTAAKHLHVARDDKNNVFGVTFRTTPMDSTGVPHILEHTALCGSTKYPVRDPFFKMLNRSLSTFMNALTASDWTMYPFSSQNTKDFKNLMSVYMDAAFNPLLRESDFRQEGWRLENEDVNDKNSPIMFKGVVFNEMKGVFSSQHSIFQEAVQNHILPDHTYGVCSGGLPLDILDLTWEQLKQFHATHYHPSNSRFYTYGDQPLETHLNMIEESVLSKFDKLEKDTSVPLQPRWDSPRSLKITCRHNDMLPDPTKQTTVTKSYLMTDICDTYNSNVLSMISSLLTTGPNAPFYQSLIESKIGSGYAPINGYQNQSRDTWFSIGLEGISESDVGRVSFIIDETFKLVANEGFPQERIDALLSQIELSLKHQTPHFGLGLSFNLSGMWIHDADPTEGLKINQFINKFREDMAANPKFLQGYIQKFFLENKHVSTVEMSPEENYEEKQQEIETTKLKSLVDNLTAEQKDKIFQQGLELASLQNEEEDLSCLPSLQKADIDLEVERNKLEHIKIDGVDVQLCEQPTNEVVYFNGLLDISDLPGHLKPYITLFCSLVTRMGAGDLDYKQQSQQKERYTGGLGAGLKLITSPYDLNHGKQQLQISSYCLKDNMEPMFKLWSDIFNSVTLDDVERTSMLLKMHAADSVNSISSSGHSYAMTHSASTINEMNRLREVLSGITQISFMKSLAENEKQDPIVGYLQDIAQHVLTKASLKCSLNAEAGVMSKATDQLQSFLSSLPGRVEEPASYSQFDVPEHRQEMRKTHFTMDFSVNYAGMTVPTVEYTHPDSACVKVMASLLRNKYLHREIREKGGAYGGGASIGSPGCLTFYSYRDPNSTKTVDTMMSSADWVSKGDFTQQDVDEAILAVFKSLDAPSGPGAKGQAVFVDDITDDMRQANRERTLFVTKQGIQEAAERYLRSPKACGVTVIGPENEVIKADNEWIISGRENCCQLPII